MTIHNPMTEAEVLALPASVVLKDAARALGISYSLAGALVRADEFPVPVLRLGPLYKVPRAELLRYLGITDPDTAHATNGSVT